MTDILISLARRGPSGVRRPCVDIRRRVLEESAELNDALASGGITSIMEEAGDVVYYLTLARENRCDVADPVAWHAVADALSRYYERPVTAEQAHEAARVAAEAKYRTRFIANRLRKNKRAEHIAILEALDRWASGR